MKNHIYVLEPHVHPERLSDDISKMYRQAKARINLHVGCGHGCIYCIPSFQRQAKRQKHRCEKCWLFEPHDHLKRAEKSPPKTEGDEFIFLNSMGDTAFAKPESIKKNIAYTEKYPDRLFLLQSKNPGFFRKYKWPKNVMLGSTIETNKAVFDTPSQYRTYTDISKAPLPIVRIIVMYNFEYPKKVVTVEPILDFDIPVFARLIRLIKPIIVYVGYDNHNCNLPEPPLWKTRKLIVELTKFTEVRVKTLRKAWYEEE